jgi:hypothetical protein
MTACRRADGSYTYSSAGFGCRRRSRSPIGWKNVCAIAVGISAEPTTTVIRSENGS